MHIHDSTDPSTNLYFFPPPLMSEHYLFFLVFSLCQTSWHCGVFFNPFAYLFDKTLRKCWTDVFNKLMFTDLSVPIYFVKLIFYFVQCRAVPVPLRILRSCPLWVLTTSEIFMCNYNDYF